MYNFYEDLVDSCQTQWDESQKFWKKEMDRWQQMSQNCLDDFASQLQRPFDQGWCSQTIKDYEAFWEKGLQFMGPWHPFSAWSTLGNASDQNAEISEELDQLQNLQSEHKKKMTEFSRQLTLLKKDMAAQKQLTKSQAVEMEALKDNLGLQEKNITAFETRLKAAEKP